MVGTSLSLTACHDCSGWPSAARMVAKKTDVSSGAASSWSAAILPSTAAGLFGACGMMFCAAWHTMQRTARGGPRRRSGFQNSLKTRLAASCCVMLLSTASCCSALRHAAQHCRGLCLCRSACCPLCRATYNSSRRQLLCVARHILGQHEERHRRQQLSKRVTESVPVPAVPPGGASTEHQQAAPQLTRGPLRKELLVLPQGQR